MAIDVFISYSSLDKNVADAVCHYMEAAGIRVWIAPRDVQPGVEWSEEIVNAITDSRVLVLVFSSNSNSSGQVKREIEIAVNRGLTILPYRIEDVLPSGSMEYFIGPHHWLDAMTPPLERHFKVLTEKVQLLLSKNDVDSAEAVPKTIPRDLHPQDLTLAEASSLADRWAKLDYPYYLVESLSQELKAMVINPPYDVQIEDAQVRSFLLQASLHYGSSWAFWAERNAGNLEAVQQVIKVLGLAYTRPRFRAICTLQFFPRETVEQAAADLEGSLDPRIGKVLEKVVLPGRAQEYLQKKIEGKDTEVAKKAGAVMQELSRNEGADDDDLDLP